MNNEKLIIFGFLVFMRNIFNRKFKETHVCTYRVLFHRFLTEKLFNVAARVVENEKELVISKTVP